MGRPRKHRNNGSPKKKVEAISHFVDSECSLLHDSKDASPDKDGIEQAGTSKDSCISSSRQFEAAASQVIPFSALELETLLTKTDVLPKKDMDGTLLRVLESIIAEVGFENADFHDLYVYFVQALVISSDKTSMTAYVALMRCVARGGMNKLVDSLITSISRSLRRGLIGPLDGGDLALLVETVVEESSLLLLRDLIDENEFAPYRRAHTGPPNRDKVTLAIEAAGYGFASIEDMLNNVDRIAIEHPGSVKQVKCMLQSIFARHRDLLETHARSIVQTSERIGYCPPEALLVIVRMLQAIIEDCLQTDNSKSLYGISLLLLANIDVENANVKQLLEAISLLGKLYQLAPSTFKDILPCFLGVFKHCASCTEQRRQLVLEHLLKETVYIAGETNGYECQLELVGFLEDLQKHAARLSNEVCEVLVDKAKGVSLINRVCGILLRLEETGGDSAPNDKMIVKVKERVKEWYSIGKDKSQTARSMEVIRLEQPNVYRYIRARKTPRDVLQDIV